MELPEIAGLLSRRALVSLAALAALAIQAGCLAAQPASQPAQRGLAADPLGKVKQSIRLKQFKEAQSQLQQMAGAGNADAQYLLAVFYLNGLNGPRDATQARPWLEKAAAQGNSRAAHSLKVLLAGGDPSADGTAPSAAAQSAASPSAANPPAANPSPVEPSTVTTPPSPNAATDPILRREALWLAAQRGDLKTVKALGDRATINAVDDFGRGALARAAEAGNPEILEMLIHAGAPINSPDAFGITPLMLAAHADRSAAIEVLLRAGADVGLADHVGNTALMHAAAGGNVVTVDRLLKANANIKTRNTQDWSALDFAEWAGATDAVRLLTADGATSIRRGHATQSVAGIIRAKSPQKDLYSGWDDVAIAASRKSLTLLEALAARTAPANLNTPDGAPALMVAVRSDAPRSLEWLLARGQPAEAAGAGSAAIALAARDGSADVVKVLLAHGASPDSRSAADGEPAIVAAARAGHTEIIKLLISARGNPGVQDRYGTNALMLAAQRSNDEMLRVLLDASVPVQLTDKGGRTALWYAARAGYLAGVSLLLQHGANIDQADEAGVSPLGAASVAGSAPVVERLLAGNAQIDAHTSRGDTPLLLATAAGRLPIADKLLVAHADKDAQNKFGDTALIIASRNGDIALVKRLLAAGASVRIRNHDRATAADVAAARSFRDLMSLLKG